jgi:hypothetical protein
MQGEKYMNCCEGNCNQGRYCPLRIAHASQPLFSKRLLRRFFYRLLIAVLGVLWLALLVACTYAYTN